MINRILTHATLISLLLAGASLAQTQPEPPVASPPVASPPVASPPAASPPVAPPEASSFNPAFLDGIRNYGFTVGYAYQCQDKQQRTIMGDQVLRLANLLVRYYGTEAAFMFTGAFGYGTGHPVDKAKCADYIAQWRESVKRYLPE